MTEQKEMILSSESNIIETKQESNLIKSNEINAIQELEARAKVMNALMDTVLKMTSPVDWIRYSKSANFADLSSDGALRIARMLGISIVACNPAYTKTQYEDYYEYEYSAIFSLGNISVHGFGIATSEDRLFSHGGKLSMEEVNEPNIRKKAQSQMYRRGIGDLLGIKRMPLDRFPKSWIDQIPVGMEDKASNKPKNQNIELIKKVESALLNSVEGDHDEALKKLRSITNANVNSLEDCSDKQLNYILVKLSKGE
ncbi:MAG: hypothetical protein M0P71_07520 [Melioribacteraceae bacterium]|jgi:hypothetical protein|nr:hypothetical protein [Melioribacteraceae bacterium]MDD3982797.1 hypothetical protein [Candidatus Omnitrophota bacterium]